MKRLLSSGPIGILLVTLSAMAISPEIIPARSFDALAAAAGDQERSNRRTRRSNAANNSQDVRTLKARVAALQAQSDSLQARVRSLEQRLQVVNSVLPELQATLRSAVAAKVALDSSELAMINQLSLILNKISMLEDKAIYVDSTNFEILSQLVLLENKIVSLTGSFNDIIAAREPSGRTAASQLGDDEFRKRYVSALTAYQNGQFREAGNQFASLIRNGPEHDLADNSQYWLAECFYDLKNYRRAIAEFEKVYIYSSSDKKDDAQYKIALSYYNAGNQDQARKEFQRLLDDFPDSDLREKSRRYLR